MVLISIALMHLAAIRARGCWPFAVSAKLPDPGGIGSAHPDKALY
jgi:hypothetical protein